MLSLIMLRTLPGDHLEMLMEGGEIIKPALETQLLDADAIVYKQFTGVPDPYLGQELRIGLAGARFEIAAKGIGHQPGDGGHFFQRDLLGEVIEGVIIDRVDPIALDIGKIMAE